MAKNISKVYLLNVPLEDDMRNTLYFASSSSQNTYFQGRIGKTYTNVSYQSETRTFRCPDQLDTVRQYNYVMWQNSAYSNKWFYAFIKEMKYVSDGYTDVIFEVDPLQTYMFDITVKASFVEREHVNDDTPGKHTVPEGLELGEYEIVDLRDSPIYYREGGNRDWVVCFAVTKYPASIQNLASNGRIKNDLGYLGGVFNGLFYFCTSDLSYAEKVIGAYNLDSGTTADAIKNIYMIPRCFLIPSQDNSYLSLNGGQTLVPLYGIYNFYESDEYQLQQPSVLAENYSPTNKKLLSYPFSYFYLSNKGGDTIEYHYEDFPIENINGNTARTMTYKKSLVPSTSLSGKLYFTKYKSYTDSASYGTKMYDYGISFAKAPVCAWTTDYYTNWLTQNGINVASSTIGGVATGLLSVAGGAMLANPMAMVSGGMSIASTVANTIGEIHRAETTPPQAHGDINAGDFSFCFQRNSVSFYEMSIRPEVAKIIDGYFSLYGYKVNELKVPNTNHRENWWYTKTIGANIIGNVPNEYMNKIKQAYDNGLTYWRNPANFLNYSVSNGIV